MVDSIDNIFQLDDSRDAMSMLRANSAQLNRLELAARAGLRFDSKRNLYKVFGYKTRVDDEDFWGKYVRQDIATRIVDAPPDATWSSPPEMTGAAEVVSAWEEVVETANLWVAMSRADKYNRLGPFSLLLFGFDDTGELDRPVKKGANLLYTRPIPSRMVAEVKLVDNPTDPRFGQPETYKVDFSDPTKRSINRGDQTSATATRSRFVHHSRAIHIVEHPFEDGVTGTPVMERVFNLLDDLLKVVGGTSETYWLASNRGMQADIDREMDFDPEDAKALEDEIEEYQHNLRRFIRTRGVKITNLGSDTPSPKEPFEMIMALISGTTGIPRRILLGSEAGQLASEQDRANWAERINERRRLFAGPSILLPTIKLLQSVGTVPEGDFEFEWPEAFIMSPLEQSQQMAQQARAIGNMSRQTGNSTPMQITSREESRNIIGLEGDLSESELQEPPPEPEPRPFLPPDEEDGDDAGDRSGTN